MMTPRLYTIRISHYAERARLALRFAQVPYEEEGYAPFSHALSLRKYGQTQTPMLQTAEGLLRDSAAICKYADRQKPGILYCDAIASDIAKWETLASGKIGPAIRVIIYGELLQSPKLFRDVLLTRATAAERRAIGLTYPVLGVVIRRGLRIVPTNIERCSRVIDSALTDIAEALRDGRSYLCGDRLGAADVAIAALLSPLARPAQAPELVARSAGWSRRRDAMQATPAGQLIERVYAAAEALPDVRTLLR
jgi:glutathione S-transferase